MRVQVFCFEELNIYVQGTLICELGQPVKRQEEDQKAIRGNQKRRKTSPRGRGTPM